MARMVTLILGAIFKQESHILLEWLRHYISQGVEHFILIDNGSTDGAKDILSPFIREGLCTYIYDESRHDQIGKYNSYMLPFAKEHYPEAWLAIVDLDEVMYGRKGKTLKQSIEGFDTDVGQISVPWKLYGSSGFVEQPPTVIDNFLYRQSFDPPQIANIKSIVRVDALSALRIHEHIIEDARRHVDASGRSMSDLSIRPNGKEPLIVIDESILDSAFIHLNHYAIQSWNWFKTVKTARGSANTSLHDNIRNRDYFKRYDHNVVLDRELHDINVNTLRTPTLTGD